MLLCWWSDANCHISRSSQQHKYDVFRVNIKILFYCFYLSFVQNGVWQPWSLLHQTKKGNFNSLIKIGENHQRNLNKIDKRLVSKHWNIIIIPLYLIFLGIGSIYRSSSVELISLWSWYINTFFLFRKLDFIKRICEC